MNSLLVEQVRFCVPARLEACAEIRERVAEIAKELLLDARDLDDLRLAVGEAASNAVKHGCKGRPWAEVEVRCWSSDSEFGVEVKDDGCGFDPDLVMDPDLVELPEGGMGIYYMRCSMDSVEFSFSEGTRVTLIKKLGNR